MITCKLLQIWLFITTNFIVTTKSWKDICYLYLPMYKYIQIYTNIYKHINLKLNPDFISVKNPTKTK